MARDYTKYTIEDLEENLNKRQLVFSIIKDYLDQNECTYKHLKEIFPDEIQGSKGVIKLKSEIKDFKRFSKESLKTSDGEDIFISNQWGKNIEKFIGLANNLGYHIEKESNNIESSNDSSFKSYTLIRVNNSGNSDDFTLIRSKVVHSNGSYILSFDLDSDGDGVIDTYRFYDIKTKVGGSNGSPWDFDEFYDEDDEWTNHESFEDFGYDSDEISETLYNMRLDFTKEFLNEASQENILYEAAVPFDKRDIFNIETFSSNADILVFESGDKNIIPDN